MINDLQIKKTWRTSCLLDWEFLILGFYDLWENKPIWLLSLHFLWSSTCSSKEEERKSTLKPSRYQG